jgi:sterol desaturase/sphingolipid hydroxylase (fatty acid hydroxylase superfamily)
MDKLMGLLFPLTWLGFVAAERIWPGRPQPRVRRWAAKGVIFFALGGLLSSALPPLWRGWMNGHRLMDLSGLGLAGALVAIPVFDLVGYWWHRLRHAATPLWRIHQLHHSAERLDAVGAFYFHPLETVAYAFLSTLLASVLGVSPAAAALTGYAGFFLSVFQHANLRTPRALGYLVQRPEQHALHHERGVHGRNFGGLALWDAVFGTYRNPPAFSGEVGFWDGASRRLGALLVGADVTRPR